MVYYYACINLRWIMDVWLIFVWYVLNSLLILSIEAKPNDDKNGENQENVKKVEDIKKYQLQEGDHRDYYYQQRKKKMNQMMIMHKIRKHQKDGEEKEKDRYQRDISITYW